MTRSLLLLGLSSLVTASAGTQPAFRTIEGDPWCRDAGHDEGRVAWCEVRETTLPAADPLVVDASPNGGAEATGADRKDVRLRVQVVAKAATESAARELAAQIRIVTTPTISAQGPASRSGSSWWVSFDLAVPRRSNLTLRSVNGPVAITGVDGRSELETHNGPVSVSRSSGLVRGRTQNGPVTADLSGTAWAGDGLDLETVNGPVLIEVPEGYNARLETGTVNGPLDLELPLVVEMRSKRDMKATLGKGGALLRVRTTNGPLRVRRP